MSQTPIDTIRTRLIDTFHPHRLELVDQSNRHAGHAHNNGGGHYHLTIAADAFTGKSLLASHRLIYQCLGDLIPTTIHALSITIET